MSMMLETYNGYAITRASTAVDAYGRVVGPNVARFEPSMVGFGLALRIEEGVTNILPPDLSAWSKTNVTVEGNKVAQTVVNGQLYRYHDVDPNGKSYTFTIELRADVPHTAGIKLENYENTEINGIDVQVTVEWKKFTITKAFTLPSTKVKATLWPSPYGSGTTNYVYARNPQLTPTAYPLTYTPGYRAPEVVTMPTYDKTGTLTNLVPEESGWEQGSLDSITGVPSAITTRYRTKNYIDVVANTQLTVSIVSGYKYGLFFYRSDNSFAGWAGWISSFPNTQTVPADATKVKVIFAKSDDSAVTVTDATTSRLIMEKGSRAGSWVPGQTRRIIDATQGEIGMMVKIDAVTKRMVAGVFPPIFRLTRPSGLTGLTLRHSDSATTWDLIVVGDDANIRVGSCQDSSTNDGWHRMVVTYTSLSANIYIDGILKATIADPKTPSRLEQFLFIGSTGAGSNFLNTLFDDIYTRSEPRTDAEIAVNPLTPWVPDAKTTSLVKYDGPDGRRFAERGLVL